MVAAEDLHPYVEVLQIVTMVRLDATLSALAVVEELKMLVVPEEFLGQVHLQEELLVH